MRKWFAPFVWIVYCSEAFAGSAELNQYFQYLCKLDFKEAKRIGGFEKDTLLRFEMLQLADILFYSGQVDRNSFKLSGYSDPDQIPLSVVSTLNQGYISLFYDRVKGNSYRHFYNALQLAKSSEDKILIKLCLLALLRYYNSDIVQNSSYHLPYIRQLESLQSDSIDRFWVTIYKMIFFTQVFEQPEDEYFKLSSILDEYEHTLDTESHLLAILFYEKAIQLDFEKKTSTAVAYYHKAIFQAKDFPFLRQYRFNGALRLMLIESNRKNFDSAKFYLHRAQNEFDRADTLLSNYALNAYSALVMKARQKYDSAFVLLWAATQEDFQLDIRKNTLEINRLNVELETQEKENANLQLRQNRTWLLTALAGVGSLLLISYFAYANQRSKNKIQAKEKEVQAMKLEKVLKDQEIFGIDAMLEGQEKERQRIAADLHDNLGSLLATLKLHFHSLKKDVVKSDQDVPLLRKTDDLLEEAYQKVRGMAHAGNAGVNAQEGLVPAVKNFASKVSILNRLAIEVKEHGMNRRLENTLEITIFRIIQELITNIIKHAHADSVVIHLTQHEATINLMVEDNGIGFDISQIKPSGGMGLYSIQKKIESLGGQVTIDSIAQKGTTVIIDIPIA